MVSSDPTQHACPVETALRAIGGRWKVLVLRELFTGTKRFGELHRALKPVTQKMLTQQLREMERDGIVHRKVYPQIPPRVEYSLTPLGRSLRPVMDSLHRWGVRHLNRFSETGRDPEPSPRKPALLPV